jgi:myo-inositol-1(or 4)-monophosphatase
VTPPRSPEIDVMVRAAEKAAASLRADLARPDLLAVREKSPSDFVSNADLRSQEIIRAELAAVFPAHDLLLEEGEPRALRSERPRFLVDPLDGTSNYLVGIPHFAVTIALEVGGEIASGIVLDVPKRELFVAARGGGAWLNGRQLHVSERRDLTKSVVGTGIPHHARGDHTRYLAALERVMRDVAGIRRMGSAALDLAYVAAGRFDAFFERWLASWDVAAGALLVQEAGGVVSDTAGADAWLDAGDILAASSPAMHRAMLERLAPLHR